MGFEGTSGGLNLFRVTPRPGTFVQWVRVGSETLLPDPRLDVFSYIPCVFRYYLVGVLAALRAAAVDLSGGVRGV